MVTIHRNAMICTLSYSPLQRRTEKNTKNFSYFQNKNSKSEQHQQQLSAVLWSGPTYPRIKTLNSFLHLLLVEMRFLIWKTFPR